MASDSAMNREFGKEGVDVDSAAAAKTFRVAGWTVHPDANELMCGDESVHVEPKPIRVLVYLAERAGKPVSRDELMAAVWPGVFVSEHALNRCVSKLRRVFGDDPRAPAVIETIPRIGYRLVAAVDWPANPDENTRRDQGQTRIQGRGPGRGRTQSHGHARDAVAGAESIPWLKRRSLPTRLALVSLAVAATVTAAVAFGPGSGPRTVPSSSRGLTTEPGTETQAAWSPDAAKVVYVHRTDDDRQRLFIRAIDDDQSAQLTDGPTDRSPVWLPDGSAVMFVRCGTASCRLASIPPAGGAIRQVFDGNVGSWGLSISPDARTVAFSAPDSSTHRFGVTVLDIVSGETRRVTSPPPGSADTDPRFSPDGDWLAFRRVSASGADLYRIPSTGVGRGSDPGSDRRSDRGSGRGSDRGSGRGGTDSGPGDSGALRLTSDNAALAGHSWAPDGRSIVFSSARSGAYSLWRVPTDGGPAEVVAGPAVRDPGGPVVAPAAHRLVVEDWAFEVNLWEMSRGAEAIRRVASTVTDKHPHLSRDGSRITFVSDRTGFAEVWTAQRDGTGLTRLTDFRGPPISSPRLSPNGQEVLFQLWTPEGADLYVVSSDGSTRRRLTALAGDEISPRWSRDGGSVFFGSRREGRWSVWRLSVSGGDLARLADGCAGEETEDGALITARCDTAGLWRTVAGQTRQLSHLPALGDWQSWTTTDETAIVVERDSGGVRLASINLDSGDIEPLPFSVDGILPGEPNLAASADGAIVIVARIDRSEADLVLVEPFE